MFEIYLSAMRAGMTMFRAGVKLGETLVASHSVIDRRVEIMKEAARDPTAGDYRELALMVPEKMDAVWTAGMKLSEGWWSAQREMAAQVQHLGAIMIRGRPPTPAELETIARRGMRAISVSTTAAGEGLAPFHKAATANARRRGKSRGARAKSR